MRSSPLAFIALLCLPAVAAAHEVGLSRGRYVVRGAEVHASLSLARAEAVALAPEVAGGDGRLDAADLPALRPTLERLAAGVEVQAGSACPGTLGLTALTEEDGLDLEIAFRCSAPATELSIRFPMLAELSPGHRHLGQLLTDRTSTSFTVHRNDSTYTTSLDAPTETGFGGMFILGVEHILTGYDHLLFLIALVLVGGRTRALIAVVTAFTLAHSVTLAVSAMGLWTPDPGWVEPAIALSIAYVGIENYFVRDAEQRWRITFPFGLVHGFGFAGVLAEIGLPADRVVSTLVAFNLGVEIGQLAVLAVVLPLLALARRSPMFVDRGVKVGSAAVVAIGLFWFIERVS